MRVEQVGWADRSMQQCHPPEQAARDALAEGMQYIDSNLTKAAMLINAAKVHAILALAEAVAGGRDHHT
jgi:hypothetical protein